MKRILSLVLALLLVFSLVGCQQSGSNSSTTEVTGGYEGTYNDILRFLQRKTLSTDVKKTRSYSMYYVGAWCTGMDVVESLIEQLPEYVEVVTPGVFMERMVANCKPSETDAE